MKKIVSKTIMLFTVVILLVSALTPFVSSTNPSSAPASIEIVRLRGGLRLSVVIRNTGDTPMTDTQWSIDFGKTAKLGNHSSGTITRMSGGEQVVLHSRFVFGIGSGSVTAVVGDFSILQKYVMIGPLLLLKKGSGSQIKNYDMMVYSRDAEHTTLDPADAYDDQSENVIAQIYDTLVTYKGNDSLSCSPSLAVNWSVAPDQRTWTFHLRQGVKFSNGDPFDAFDVKYSFDRVLLVRSPDSGVSWMLSQCMNLNSTTVIDPYTVQIRLVKPYGGFLALLAFTVASIVDKDYVEAHGGIVPGEDNLWMKEHPMGTGPYQLEDCARDGELLLHKNPYYWAGWDGNHVEKVLFKTTSDIDARISAIRSGDADVIDISYENLTGLVGAKGITVHLFDDYNVDILIMNTKSYDGFMGDGRVRKALSYGFDYDAAIETAFEGYASRLAGAIPNGMPYYKTQNNGQPYYTFNVTKAGQVLDDAGYLRDFDINGTLYRFNGSVVRIFYDSKNVKRETLAHMFQKALGDLGIRSSVTAEDWPQYLHRIYTTDEWEIAFLGWMPDYNDPDTYILPFVGSAAIGGDTFNTGWANATVDDLILQGKYTIDPHMRNDSYTQAYAVYIDQPSLIYVAQQKFVCPMRDWVMNYSFNPAPGLSWRFYDCYKGFHGDV
ncbi:MAG TPA: ABC transporter substrate-binding protein [Candidatus Thermoplasmatota archaeon]|nr:ABC transporter substrate-binding protein [Candidatus Thermoplasmatota archaeon]